MSSFRQFLSENKIWWVLPILIVLGIVGFIIVSEDDQPIPGKDAPFNYDEY